jgi:phosphate transport system substrate-binding protein
MKQTTSISHTLLKTLIILTLVSPILSGCSQRTGQDENELSGTLTVSGAWALYPMMVRWGEKFGTLHPGVQFDISAGGAGKGMADVLAGAVDIGMVSREIYPEEIEQGAFWVATTMDAVVPGPQRFHGDGGHSRLHSIRRLWCSRDVGRIPG